MFSKLSTLAFLGTSLAQQTMQVLYLQQYEGQTNVTRRMNSTAQYMAAPVLLDLQQLGDLMDLEEKKPETKKTTDSKKSRSSSKEAPTKKFPELKSWYVNTPAKDKDASKSANLAKSVNLEKEPEFQSPFFKMHGGAIRMTTPKDGALIVGSVHPRTELRQNKSFKISKGNHQLTVTLKVVKTDKDKSVFNIGQIGRMDRHAISKTKTCNTHVKIQYDPKKGKINFITNDKDCKHTTKSYEGKFPMDKEIHYKLRTHDGKVYFKAGKESEKKIGDFSFAATDKTGKADPSYFRFGIHLSKFCANKGTTCKEPEKKETTVIDIKKFHAKHESTAKK